MSENIQIKHSTIPHIIKHNKVDPEQILLEELTKNMVKGLLITGIDTKNIRR